MDTAPEGKTSRHNTYEAVQDARLIGEMCKEQIMNRDDIAFMFGKSPTWVSRRVALLRLHPRVLGMVEDGSLLFSIATFLSKYPDHTFQLSMAEIVTEKQLNSTKAKRHIECAALAFGVWPKTKRSKSSRVAVLNRLCPGMHP